MIKIELILENSANACPPMKISVFVAAVAVIRLEQTANLFGPPYTYTHLCLVHHSS